MRGLSWKRRPHREHFNGGRSTVNFIAIFMVQAFLGLDLLTLKGGKEPIRQPLQW